MESPSEAAVLKVLETSLKMCGKVLQVKSLGGKKEFYKRSFLSFLKLTKDSSEERSETVDFIKRQLKQNI